MKHIKAFFYALNTYLFGLMYDRPVGFWDCYRRRLAFLEIFED